MPFLTFLLQTKPSDQLMIGFQLSVAHATYSVILSLDFNCNYISLSPTSNPCIEIQFRLGTLYLHSMQPT